VLHTRTETEYRARAASALLPAIAGVETLADESSENSEATARTSDIIDVSRTSSGDRTFLQGLASLAGATGIALLVPFVILVVGLAVVLPVRGVLELLRWLFGVVGL